MSISYASLQFFVRWSVRTEIERLQSICLYLQQSAIASGKQYTLVCDIPNNSYSYESTTIDLPQGVIFGAALHVQGPPSSPHAPITKAVTFLDNSIQFYPDGTIQSGVLYLTDRDYHFTYALSIGVASIACIRIYQYHNNWALL